MSESEQKKVLVLGATGALGRLVCKELSRTWGASSVIVGSRNAHRGSEFASQFGIGTSARCVDVTDSSSISKVINPGLAAVIIAVPQAKPIVQAACISDGVPCLDVTVDEDLIKQARHLDSDAKAHRVTSIVTAGLFPGLSGVMAMQAIKSLDEPSSIDVSLLQSSNAVAGTNGIADMLGVFARPVQLKTELCSQPIHGFTEKREMVFPDPFGRREVRLIDYPEANIVAQMCGVSHVNYWTGYDTDSLQRLISSLNKVRLLRLFNVKATRRRFSELILATRTSKGSSSETTALTVEAKGHIGGEPRTIRLGLVAPSDYGATAKAVVAMTKLLIEDDNPATGVYAPIEAFQLDSLIEAMDSDEISLTTIAPA